MNILGYKLKLTSVACPEQYDVFKDNVNVGYLRLRYGCFTVECPFNGEVVYKSYPVGDGMFTLDERDYFLTMAINAIDSKLKET